MTFPVLQLTGTPYEQGVQHGRQLTDRIAHNLGIYFNRFEREVKLSRAEVLGRAAKYLQAIEVQNSDYFAVLNGIATGSGFDLLELAALNVRYEILYYQFGVNAMADGCTAFALLPEAAASGHLTLGQNWDWIPQVKGALLETVEPDGLRTLSFTEAGIAGGKIGLNSAGLGLAINGMTTTDDDWGRLTKPFHVRCYEILRQREFDAAVRVVTDEARSCSTNFLIAQTPDRVVDVEAAPDKVRLLNCEAGCLVHSNHFVDPQGMGIVEPPNERRPYSHHRRARLGELLRSGGGAATQVSADELEDYLRDHADYPYGICRHADPAEPPEEHYVTVTSIVMDLDARIMRLTDGPPCESDYQEVRLA